MKYVPVNKEKGLNTPQAINLLSNEATTHHGMKVIPVRLISGCVI